MLSDRAKYRINMFGVMCGFGYIVAIVIGWALVAGFIPPHHPSSSASEIAPIFRSGVTHIRIGMLITMIGAALAIPFGMVTARYIARVEGGFGILSLSMAAGGICTAVLTFYPAIFWLVAAFRPDRSADIIHVLNDWAWLQLVGGTTIWWPMPFSMAVVAFCDRSAVPVFPRWSGYMCIFLFLALLPDQLLFFFRAGPFAWNGMFGFWIPLGAFGGWFILASSLMVAALKRGVLPDSPIA